MILPDLAIGAGSFGISWLSSLIAKTAQSSANKHSSFMDVITKISAPAPSEEDKQRTQELELKRLGLIESQEKRSYKDVENARGMTNRFMSVTRRFIAWIVPYLFIILGIAMVLSVFKNVPAVSLVTSSTHSFLFGLISYTAPVVERVYGFVILPWFQQLAFMIAGFYFGRDAAIRF